MAGTRSVAALKMFTVVECGETVDAGEPTCSSSFRSGLDVSWVLGLTSLLRARSSLLGLVSHWDLRTYFYACPVYLSIRLLAVSFARCYFAFGNASNNKWPLSYMTKGDHEHCRCDSY